MDFQNNIQEKKDTILKGFGIVTFDEKEGKEELEKGGKKTGVYTDTAENRSKNRVGQKYSKDKVDEPTKEKPKKKEDESKSRGKKGEEDKKSKGKKEEGGEKSVTDHAKDTSTGDLQKFVDNAKGGGEHDPGHLAEAEKELKSRSKEDKSPSELELMKLEDDYKYYQDEHQSMIDYLEQRQTEAKGKGSTLLNMMVDNVDEADKELATMKKDIDKLKEKIKKEKQPKIEKDPKAFIATASVDEIANKAGELAKESSEALANGNYKKADKLAKQSAEYSQAVSDKLGALSKTNITRDDVDNVRKKHIKSALELGRMSPDELATGINDINEAQRTANENGMPDIANKLEHSRLKWNEAYEKTKEGVSKYDELSDQKQELLNELSEYTPGSPPAKQLEEEISLVSEKIDSLESKKEGFKGDDGKTNPAEAIGDDLSESIGQDMTVDEIRDIARSWAGSGLQQDDVKELADGFKEKGILPEHWKITGYGDDMDKHNEALNDRSENISVKLGYEPKSWQADAVWSILRALN